MTHIINDIRSMMKHQNQQQMNRKNIFEKLKKINPSRYSQKNYTMDNIFECLAYYKKLNVVFMDEDHNVIFLWAHPYRINIQRLKCIS